jgi:hypothetical protein
MASRRNRMISWLSRMALVILSLSAMSCVSLSLAGEKVRVTKHESDVEGCRFLGEVEAHPNRCRTGAGRVYASNIEPHW